MRKRLSEPTRGRRARRALQADVGQPAERRSRGRRRSGSELRRRGAQPLGIVVGELVDHREGPHLHREEGDVALARARAQHGERQRAPRRRRRSSPGRGSGAAGAAAARRPRRRSRRRLRPARHAQRRRWPERLHEVGEYRSTAAPGCGAAPPRVIRMAALWRPTLLAPTRSTPCFGSASSPRRSSSSRSTSALIYALRRYRAERGAEPRQVTRRPPHPVPGRRRAHRLRRRDPRRSASSSPTRRARRRPPAPAGLQARPLGAAADRSDRPAVAVALRLPERRLLLLQARRPGRHRGRTRPRLHRRRPHLGRARPGRQARRGPRQDQPRRLPRRRRGHLRRPVGDPLRPGLRGDADRGRSRLARGVRRLHRRARRATSRPPRTGSSA